jgi:hypothetical protein
MDTISGSVDEIRMWAPPEGALPSSHIVKVAGLPPFIVEDEMLSESRFAGRIVIALDFSELLILAVIVALVKSITGFVLKLKLRNMVPLGMVNPTGAVATDGVSLSNVTGIPADGALSLSVISP